METPKMETSGFGFLPNTTASMLCISVHAINSRGIFNGTNPLKYSTPLLLLQIFLTTFTALVVSVLLKPIGMPPMVSQIFAGILLGPTFLGKIDIYLKQIFPLRSFVMIDTYATLGTIFQIFLVGIQMNPVVLRNAGRKAIVIGISVVFLPLTLSLCSAFLLSYTIGLDYNVSKTLLVVGATQSMSAFPVIASYLSELNILNSEVSRIAFSSSMMSGLLCFTMVSSAVVLQLAINKAIALLSMCLASALMVVVAVFIMRPLIIRMIRNIPEGQTVKEQHLSNIFLAALMLAYFCKMVRMHMLYGPFLLGAAIPAGPPLGSALVDRLEYFNTWLIMPVFFTEHGMRIDFSKIKLSHALLVQFVLLISCTGKFLGAFLPALYYNMTKKDASLLGLAMNVQGFLEIILFKVLMDFQLIDYESFEIMSASMIAITMGLTPVIRYLYKSSMKFQLHNQRTIQHSEPNSELRVLACIHDQENVPSVIHLLKASSPTKSRPINLSVVHLVELVGRATPLIISHNVHRKSSAAIAVSQRIVNVFKRYEANNEGCISLHPYTVVSPYPSMHNDVCMLAHHKRSSFIILPYHKDLTTGTVNGGIRAVNSNVLEGAPCSVGILIDRGLLGGIKYVFANWASYNVVVVFFGGADDREALAYGARMSEHPTIALTVIRFSEASEKADGDPVESVLDDEMISQFKSRTAYNSRVSFVEEQVKNGVGVINVIEAMQKKYELILLGRRHDGNSKLVLDLTEWKCSELGTIGDVFLTAGYGGKATILMVQQQTRVVAHPRDSFSDTQDSQASSPPYQMLNVEEDRRDDM